MSAISAASPLILASTSRYRAGLLRRLNVPFVQEAPGCDETPQPDEPAESLARRLAQAKAEAVASRHAGRWVLGSDQVCACGDELLGKPGTRERAVAQLLSLSGRSARFVTAVALLNGAGHGIHRATDITTVRFRQLSRAEIERYVDAEPAFDCAGSFQSEGLGIALCAGIESGDPTGLVGLPLIAVRQLLAQAGWAVP